MARKRKGNPVHGWVNLDKPYDLGSTPAVGRTRWLFTAQKAGHAGTLDPLATGILPIALGEATKTIPYLVDADKAYRFTLAFGHETTTADVEGEPTEHSDHIPSGPDIRAALPDFIGEIDQVPPRFSAIKIDGQRAYDLARAGIEVDMPTRRVRIDDLRLIDTDANTATLEVDCGKGTYVRSIARDLARALKARAHVTALRRTRVGSFTLETSTTLDALEADPSSHLLPMHLSIPHLPRADVTDAQDADLAFGRALFIDAPDADPFAVFHQGTLRALGTLTDNTFQPRKLLTALQG